MLAEYLSFLIMVPLAILSWRAVAAIFFARSDSSRTARIITAMT